MSDTKSRIQSLRSYLACLVKTKRDLKQYAYNDFVIKETYYPRSELATELEPGFWWFMGLSSDEALLTRGRTATEDLPIHFGFQRYVDVDSLATMDLMTLLVEQVKHTIRLDRSIELDGQVYAWQRNESIKDPNGLPVSYMGLRNGKIYETYFTAYFRTVLVGKGG
jgi:hypothetical protein